MKKLVIVAMWVFVMVGQTLPATAPSFPATPLSSEPVVAEPAPRACLHPENVIATMADGYIAFVSATPIHPDATEWPEERRKAAEKTYAEVILGGYAGPRGFGSLAAWARAFGISQVPAICPGPDCCNAGGALRFMYVPGAISRAGWYQFGIDQLVPAIQTSCATDDCPYPDLAYHELAHIWDHRLDGVLSAALDEAMGVVRKASGRLDIDYYYGRMPGEGYLPDGKPPIVRHGDFPSSYFDSADPTQPTGGEHFAETVAAYFLIEQGDRYDYPVCWTDEDPRCPTGRTYGYDRYDFIRELFESVVASDQTAG